jgi:hypothetical protein
MRKTVASFNVLSHGSNGPWLNGGSGGRVEPMGHDQGSAPLKLLWQAARVWVSLTGGRIVLAQPQAESLIWHGGPLHNKPSRLRSCAIIHPNDTQLGRNGNRARAAREPVKPPDGFIHGFEFQLLCLPVFS